VPGLSKLQRWILRAALNKLVIYERAEDDESSLECVGNEATRLFYSEIKLNRGDVPNLRLPRSHGEENASTGWVFRKLNTPKYNSRSVTVARAAKRLWMRGLVILDSFEFEEPDLENELTTLQETRVGLTAAGCTIAVAIEITTPGAFGFTPIDQRRLFEIVERISKSKVGGLGVRQEFVEWVPRPGRKLATLITAICNNRTAPWVNRRAGRTLEEGYREKYRSDAPLRVSRRQ
jgi:hypothetical protein